MLRAKEPEKVARIRLTADIPEMGMKTGDEQFANEDTLNHFQKHFKGKFEVVDSGGLELPEGMKKAKLDDKK